MKTNKEIRALSRSQLSGNWGKFALVILVTMIVLIMVNGLQYKANSFLLSILSTLLSFVFGIAILNLSLKLARGNGFELKNVLVKPRVYLRYIGYAVIIGVIQFVIAFVGVFLIGGSFIGAILGGTSTIETSTVDMSGEFSLLQGASSGMLIIAVISILVIMALIIYIQLLYYAAEYTIISDHDDIGVIDSMRLSRKLIKGRKWKLIGLQLSFIGWGILSIFTLGIGLLWLAPYMQVSLVNFYLELLNDKEELARESGLIIDNLGNASDHYNAFNNGNSYGFEDSQKDNLMNNEDNSVKVLDDTDKNDEIF